MENEVKELINAIRAKRSDLDDSLRVTIEDIEQFKMTAGVRKVLYYIKFPSCPRFMEQNSLAATATALKTAIECRLETLKAKYDVYERMIEKKINIESVVRSLDEELIVRSDRMEECELLQKLDKLKRLGGKVYAGDADKLLIAVSAVDEINCRLRAKTYIGAYVEYEEGKDDYCHKLEELRLREFQCRFDEIYNNLMYLVGETAVFRYYLSERFSLRDGGNERVWQINSGDEAVSVPTLSRGMLSRVLYSTIFRDSMDECRRNLEKAIQELDALLENVSQQFPNINVEAKNKAQQSFNPPLSL